MIDRVADGSPVKLGVPVLDIDISCEIEGELDTENVVVTDCDLERGKLFDGE